VLLVVHRWVQDFQRASRRRIPTPTEDEVKIQLPFLGLPHLTLQLTVLIRIASRKARLIMGNAEAAMRLLTAALCTRVTLVCVEEMGCPPDRQSSSMRQPEHHICYRAKIPGTCTQNSMIHLCIDECIYLGWFRDSHFL
jgi:hypothetical protein